MTVRPVQFDTVVWTIGATPLTEHVPAYRAYLVDRGYAASYVEYCEAVVARLDQWMSRANKRPCDLDENLIAEFLCQRVPRQRATVLRRRCDGYHAPLVHLLVVLRIACAVPPKALDTTPVGEELRRFDHYLSHARGLARSTRENTLRIVGRLLRERFAGDAIKFDAVTQMAAGPDPTGLHRTERRARVLGVEGPFDHHCPVRDRAEQNRPMGDGLVRRNGDRATKR